MKKKLTLLLVILINISYFCYSQPGDDNLKRAESVQIAYFTKELGLTAEETQKFWPVYNNYRNEIRGIRRAHKGDQIALEEGIVNTRKKYRNDFKRVLGSEDRVNKLFVTEKNFRDMLRKELIKRRMNRDDDDPDR